MPPRRRPDTPDDAATRKARADALRDRIEQLGQADEPADAEETPRDFIHRRMKEVHDKESAEAEPAPEPEENS